MFANEIKVFDSRYLSVRIALLNLKEIALNLNRKTNVPLLVHLKYLNLLDVL